MIDLPSVATTSTPNSNEYFSFKNAKGANFKSKSKVNSIVNDEQSSSRELFYTCRGTKAAFTNSSESLPNAMNGKLAPMKRQ